MKLLFTTGALFGALAVVLGAFGAHKLKDMLQPDQLQTFETGVRYHFYHVLAIMVAAIFAMKFPSAGFPVAGWLFLSGIVLFSGSIYLLACKDLLNIDHLTGWIGPITPIGGVLFIAGWIVIAFKLFKNL